MYVRADQRPECCVHLLVPCQRALAGKCLRNDDCPEMRVVFAEHLRG
jgi:hypothetical protein